MADLATSLHDLYQASRYSDVVRLATDNSLSPGTHPLECKIFAASLFQLDEYKSCYELLVELESICGEDTDYLSLFAASARRIGKFDQASDLFQKALRIDPSSPQIRNNYANLLIDINKYDQALTILEELISQNPDYKDANENLKRLKDQITQMNEVSSPLVDSPLQHVDLGDPLLLAFEQEEVDYSFKRYFPSGKISDPSLNFDNLSKPDTHSVALDQLKFAEGALKSGDMSTVLKLCSKVLSALGQDSRVYDLASDAYLNLNQISQSELCLLHAVAIGGHTCKRCFNLASFAMMRGNYGLAKIYLDHAASIDPSSSHLAQLRSLLKAESANSKSNYVFQQIWPDPDARKKN